MSVVFFVKQNFLVPYFKDASFYFNSNLIGRIVSRQVDEVIPSDHLRRDFISVSHEPFSLFHHGVLI